MKVIRNNDAEREGAASRAPSDGAARAGEAASGDSKGSASANIIEIPLASFDKGEGQAAAAPDAPSSGIKIRVPEAGGQPVGDAVGPVEEEYEYVPVSEAFSPAVSKVKSFIGEYYVFIICLVLVGLCVLIINVGTTLPSFFVILAFAAIAALLIFAIFSAWKAKKKAEMDYERGKAIYETVHKNMMEEAEKDEQE